MKKQILFCLLISLVFFTANGSGVQGASEDASSVWKAPARAARKNNPVPADAKSLALGKDVYGKECLACHGEKGKGDGPRVNDLETKPLDLSDAKIVEQSDGALFWKITEGKKPMPGYEQLLTEDQRWQVINYLRTFSAKGK